MYHESCNKKGMRSDDPLLHATRYMPRDRGFIKIILLIVIGLIVLGYLGINLKDVLASPVVKENLSYAWHLAQELWTNWLRTPFMWVWEHIVKFFWRLFWNGVGDLKSGSGPQTLMQ